VTENDRATFAQQLFIAGEVFNEPVSEARASGYFAALSDLDVCDVVAGIVYAMRESRFFPRPADIRAFTTHTADELADIAWAQRKKHPEVLQMLGVHAYDLDRLDLRDLLRLREPFRQVFKRELAAEERERLLDKDGPITLALAAPVE